jgi:hypothetical protein
VRNKFRVWEESLSSSSFKGVYVWRPNQKPAISFWNFQLETVNLQGVQRCTEIFEHIDSSAQLAALTWPMACEAVYEFFLAQPVQKKKDVQNFPE